jgi:glycosyltransferase involved in cell wall biosynthesis
MTRRQKLLFLSPIVPAPSGNGLAMRAGFFLGAYARHFDVDLAVFPIAAAPAVSESFLAKRTVRFKVFPRPPVDTHFSLVASITDPEARLLAFHQYGRPSLASRVGVIAQEMLTGWLGDQRYDAVHVERLYLAPLAERWMFLPLSSRPRLMLDRDDDDAETYRRLARIARRPQAAAWARAEAAAFVSLARTVLPRFDMAFAASRVDVPSLSEDVGAPVMVVPNVAPDIASPLRPSIGRGRQSLLFVGSMGYPPNEDAARWFLARIWPRLRRRVNRPLRLVLAGSNPSASLARLARQRDVQLTGTVRDMGPYYCAADLVVIPIRVGGGTRIKLLEAAAYGLPIVSTTIGAEGTTFRNGLHLLLADTEETFLRSCVYLLEKRQRAMELAHRARAKVAQDYDAGRWSRQVVNWATGRVVT